MANHDDSEGWDDEDEEEEWQRPSKGRAPEHAPHPQYEAPIAPGKMRPPPNPRPNTTRPRSESRTDLPDPPPTPNGHTHHAVVRSNTTKPQPPAKSVLPGRTNNVANARMLFENSKSTPSRNNNFHAATHGTPSPHQPHPQHTRQISNPERPPRPPNVVPRTPNKNGSGHRPMPKPPIQRPEDRSGHTPHHRQDSGHDAKPKAAKTPSSKFQPLTSSGAMNGAPHVKDMMSELKARGARRSEEQSSETHKHHQHQTQNSLRNRVSFDDPVEPPNPPPPRNPPPIRHAQDRPMAAVRPSPSTVGSAGRRGPRHIIQTTPSEDPLHMRHWYHDKINRDEAERRLRQRNVNGAFLVREGKQEQIPFVLSLIHNDHVYHTFVRKKANGSFAAGKGEKLNEPEFECIEKLIAHYRDHEIYLMGKQPDTGIQCSTLLTMHAEKPMAR